MQLMIRVGAIGMTATNLQQDVTFMHSYQKPVSQSHDHHVSSHELPTCLLVCIPLQKKLLEALRRTESPPVLVFCNSVETVDKVSVML